MPFDKKQLNRWVKYAGSDGGFSIGREWAGTEKFEQIQPVLGAPFASSYPFKITKLEDNAPTIKNSQSIFSPSNTEITIKVCVEMGYVYDLYKLEKSKSKPLLISKLKSGDYRVVDFLRTRTLTPKDLEPYRIPVLLNGVEMKPINFSDQKSIDRASLTVTVKTNKSGQFFYEGSDELLNPGMIFFVMTMGPRHDGNYTPIIKIELMSYAQAKEKSGRPNLNDSIFLTNKYIMPLFSAYQNSRYTPLESFDETYFSKNTDPGLSTVSPLFLKQGKEPSYTHVFNLYAPRTQQQIGGFSDHVFLRIR